MLGIRKERARVYTERAKARAVEEFAAAWGRPPPAPAPWAPSSGDENEYVKVRKEMFQIVEFEESTLAQSYHGTQSGDAMREFADSLPPQAMYAREQGEWGLALRLDRHQKDLKELFSRIIDDERALREMVMKRKKAVEEYKAYHRQKNPNFLRNYEDELKNPAKRQLVKWALERAAAP